MNASDGSSQPAGEEPEIPPWPDYREQSEETVIALIHQLRDQTFRTLDKLEEVRAWEAAHLVRERRAPQPTLQPAHAADR